MSPTRDLVDPGEREPEAGGGEDERRHELAGRSGGSGRPHRNSRDHEEEAERVARRSRPRRQEHESGRRPDAAEEAHAGRGDAVTGEESEDRGGELEGQREGEHAEGDLPALGRRDPAELQAGTTKVAAARPKKPSASGPASGREDDARCGRDLLAGGSRGRRGGHPTTSACGAPVLIRVRNHFACVSASVVAVAGEPLQLRVSSRLRGLRAIAQVTATSCARR